MFVIPIPMTLAADTPKFVPVKHYRFSELHKDARL